LRSGRVERGEHTHRQRAEDHDVHHVEEARPRPAGPRIGRLRLGDDRRETRLDRLELLRALEVDQLELGLVARGLVGDDLVDDRGERADHGFEQGHGSFLGESGKPY